jgi:hypothetical protein
MSARFVIINTCDAPIRDNVAEWIAGVGYCYMARGKRPLLKLFDGMDPSRPTNIEDFGFQVSVVGAFAKFVRVSESRATYEDGKPRRWQEKLGEESFTLPLVSGVRKKAKRKRA